LETLLEEKSQERSSLEREKMIGDFNSLQKKYFDNGCMDTEAEALQKCVSKMIRMGIVNEYMDCYYDNTIEKFRTVGLQSGEVNIKDSHTSIRALMSSYYGSRFMPRSIVDNTPTKLTEFNPHATGERAVDGVMYINMYRETKYMGIRRTENNTINKIKWDSVPTWKEVFDNVFPKKKEQDYFLNWLAYGLQTRSKCRTAIITKGIEGAGKGLIYEQIIQKIVGKQYTSTITQETLSGRFNGQLENKLFILANEVKADFRDGNSTYEKLKMYVTDKTLNIENKGVKTYEVENYFNLWLHSNEAIPIQIGATDRRYTVTESSSRKILDIAVSKGYGDMNTYVELLKEEAHNLCVQIMLLKTDPLKATNPMESDAKRTIVNATIPKVQSLCVALQRKDQEYIYSLCSDIFEDLTPLDDVSVKRGKRLISFDNFESLAIEILTQLETGYIETNFLSRLYISCVNSTHNATKRGIEVSKYLGKAIQRGGISKRPIS